MARLATHVHVPDESGTYHVFGPGDDVPAWAAEVITNPAAWDGDAPDPVDTDDAADLDGGPSDSWKVPELKAYAAEHGIELGEATKKADILAAIAAGDPGDDGEQPAGDDGDHGDGTGTAAVD
ncbi:hypothetical protein [Rhodococcus sp. NPDC127528]|uniref:hypothetical protein n=1 Tax=unclassified Rhodococcus (in: high G+C Gram-positive bacteria) TaxID=192944 RepID=UPI0036332A31